MAQVGERLTLKPIGLVQVVHLSGSAKEQGRQYGRSAREKILANPEGILLRPEQTRRNVLTSGIDLAQLVGRQFRVGTAICYGRRRCQPCSYLEGMTQPGVLKAMVDRGGLFTEIVRDGEICVGDAVEPIPVGEEFSREIPSAA